MARRTIYLVVRRCAECGQELPEQDVTPQRAGRPMIYCSAACRQRAYRRRRRERLAGGTVPVAPRGPVGGRRGDG